MLNNPKAATGNAILIKPIKLSPFNKASAGKKAATEMGNRKFTNTWSGAEYKVDGYLAKSESLKNISIRAQDWTTRNDNELIRIIANRWNKNPTNTNSKYQSRFVLNNCNLTIAQVTKAIPVITSPKASRSQQLVKTLINGGNGLVRNLSKFPFLTAWITCTGNKMVNIWPNPKTSANVPWKSMNSSKRQPGIPDVVLYSRIVKTGPMISTKTRAKNLKKKLTL